MAPTKKRRKRKRRGTQGGGIDRRGPQGRPRNRQEAKARAQKRARSSPKVDRRDIPPTWADSARRGVVAALIFSALMLLLFDRGPAEALGLGAFMLVLYIPMGYFMDRFFYSRRLAAKRRERERRAESQGRGR